MTSWETVPEGLRAGEVRGRVKRSPGCYYTRGAGLRVGGRGEGALPYCRQGWTGSEIVEGKSREKSGEDVERYSGVSALQTGGPGLQVGKSRRGASRRKSLERVRRDRDRAALSAVSFLEMLVVRCSDFLSREEVSLLLSAQRRGPEFRMPDYGERPGRPRIVPRLAKALRGVNFHLRSGARRAAFMWHPPWSAVQGGQSTLTNSNGPQSGHHAPATHSATRFPRAVPHSCLPRRRRRAAPISQPTADSVESRQSFLARVAGSVSAHGIVEALRDAMKFDDIFGAAEPPARRRRRSEPQQAAEQQHTEEKSLSLVAILADNEAKPGTVVARCWAHSGSR